MTDNELSPPHYNELFDGYSDLALKRGTKTLLPDTGFEPGNDGTRTPDGQPAWSHVYEVGAEDMPASLADTYTEVKLVHTLENVYDGEVEPLGVFVGLTTHERSKLFKICKHAGAVAIDFIFDNPIEPSPGVPRTLEEARSFFAEFEADKDRLSEEAFVAKYESYHNRIKLNLDKMEADGDDVQELRKVLRGLSGDATN